MALNAKEFALEAVRLLNEKKAVDVILLDLANVSLIADYFIICNGTSKIQAGHFAIICWRTFQERRLQLAAEIEGYRDASWILMDYGVLVIPIFIAEERSFYNLRASLGKSD